MISLHEPAAASAANGQTAPSWRPLPMMRRFRNYLKSWWTTVFHLGQRFGVDILPRHFYSEVPDIRRLRSTDHWRKPYSFAGVNGIDVDKQLEFARSTVTPELTRRLAKGDVYQSACGQNGEVGYGPVEADFLHAFIATHRPRQLIQVGCGVSTAICLAAAREVGFRQEITCIEPYPSAFLRQAADRGEINLIAKPVELVDHGLATALNAGDLFFIDSTHTLGPAGEVTRIILEWLPQLKPGVYVHFHDIFFPYDYTREVLKTALFFQHESSLLHAFLAFNRCFSIMVSMSMLHYQRSSELAELLLNYGPARNQDGLTLGPGHFPSATYLKAHSAKL